MRHTIAAAVMMALSACGSPAHWPETEAPNPYIESNYGNGYQYDLSSSDGVRFRNDPTLLVIDQAFFQRQVVQAWWDAEACTGVTSPGPLVLMKDISKEGLASVGTGWAQLDTWTVVVSPIAITDPYFYTGNPDVGRAPGTSTLRHEFVHLLESKGALSYDDNFNHRSPLFDKCSGLP